MKRLILILFSATLLLACSKETTVQLVKFTDTGCDKSSLAPATKSGSDSQLILEYSEEGLVVTRTNAIMNCSIGQGGISCDVSFEDNVIHYHAYETDGPIMKCLCPVKEMSSVISGLRVGREYVLDYTCSDTPFAPISFTYQKGMKLVLDADLYTL